VLIHDDDEVPQATKRAKTTVLFFFSVIRAMDVVYDDWYVR